MKCVCKKKKNGNASVEMKRGKRVTVQIVSVASGRDEESDETHLRRGLNLAEPKIISEYKAVWRTE